jgi:hypothetical protein
MAALVRWLFLLFHLQEVEEQLSQVVEVAGVEVTLYPRTGLLRAEAAQHELRTFSI